MDYKKEMLKLLNDLKQKNHSRRKIEAFLGYAPKALDQLLAKGGSEAVLIKLRDYKKEVDKGNIPSLPVNNKHSSPISERLRTQFLLMQIAKLRFRPGGPSPEEIFDELQQDLALFLKQHEQKL